MVKTRQHKTFDDSEEFSHDANVQISTNPESTGEISDSDDSDSDDAPEEESVSVAKQNIIKKQKDQAKILKQKRDDAKAKHKEIEERRKIAKLEREIKELEKQRIELNKEEEEDQILEELPEELLENVDLVKEESKSKKSNKKIVFNESEEDKKLERVNKRMKREERLKKLREIRGTTKKQVEGDIYVELLKDDGNLKKVQSSSIKNQKNEWLVRKRVRRE